MLKRWFQLVFTLLLVFGFFVYTPVFAASIEALNIDQNGVATALRDYRTWRPISMSDDGRYAVFPSPRGGASLRDRVESTTKLLTPAGFYPDYGQTYREVKISGDGNYVVLCSTNFARDTVSWFLIDLTSNEVELIRSYPIGSPSQGFSEYVIDYDGDVYFCDSITLTLSKYDRKGKQVVSIDQNPIGRKYLTVDGDGKTLCYVSSGLFIYDLESGNKTLIGKGYDGSLANAPPFFNQISKTGDFVIFVSGATNLVPLPPSPAIWDVFVYDVANDEVTRLDMNHPDYGQLYLTPHTIARWYALGISGDGRFVTIATTTADMNRNNHWGTLLDRETGEIEFIESVPDGVPEGFVFPTISPDGRYVTYWGMGYHAGQYGGPYAFIYDRLFGQDYAVDAGTAQVAEQTSVFGADAVLHGELTSDNCTSGTFEWSWIGGSATGTDPIVQLPSGTTTITLNWSGCGMTAEDNVVITVQDTLLPTLSANASGTQGNNGWYVGDVTVALDATDSGSGVQEILYSLNGGVQVADPGASATAVLSLEGQSVLTVQAVDVAGNASVSQALNLSIDKTAPTSSATVDGKLNSDGLLYVTEVVVSLQSVDATSGLQSIGYSINGGAWQTVTSADVVSFIDDGTFNLQYYSIDQAGNSEPVKQATFTIDQSLLGPTLIEDLQDIVPDIPDVAFDGNNPNYAGKLGEEMNKVLAALDAIDDTLTPAEKLREYEWARMKLDVKVRDEFVRMINDQQVLNDILLVLDEAITALDVQISELQASL